MSRRIVIAAALLGICVTALGGDEEYFTLVDDFESYWGTPAMVSPLGPWQDTSPATSSARLSLGGVPMAGAWLDMTWTIGGGWAEPDNPTNYDSVAENAGAGITFAPYDIREYTRIRMSLKAPEGTEMPTGEYLIEWVGDAWSQTWIPSWKSGAQWWIPPEQIPAVCWDDAWGYDPYVPGNYDYSGLPRLEVGGDWVDIIIDAQMFVTWGDPLWEFDALTGINIYAYSPQRDADTSGASGDFKIGTDGTTAVWPSGPQTGQILVDNIWFSVIPEPVTICLLGAGGLVVLGRRR
jgi:hypothetical protein